MLLYADQPTPPFNSPYQQHATRTASLLNSPYPSPGRHESRSKYPQGLGLYEYQHPLPTGLPPSPQPSEAWGRQFSTGASPLMSETIADPWTSGAFDHPVSRSPLPWTSAQTSPRSSMSSYTREMSVFSHDGSEQAFPAVKLESSGWGSDVHFSAERPPAEMSGMSSSRAPPLTVAPERLNAGIYPYGNIYPSPSIPRYEPAPLYDYGGPKFERAPSEDSINSLRSGGRSSYTAAGAAREKSRNRRHTDPAHAAYRCQLCPDKGFARRYNYNQHMLTHDTYRKKDNMCTFPGCGKEFVRKTDLARHDQSVHQRAKPFKCAKCPSAFSRKDTLRRHEEDGCPRRNQIPVTNAHMLSQLQNDAY
ncbi:Nn.00g116180.m01.CDS01 [Neocucurbitaria sp. VM-36]